MSVIERLKARIASLMGKDTMPVSEALRARIAALPHEDLKAGILDTLRSTGIKRAQAHARITGESSATDEDIFELMVRSDLKVKARRENAKFQCTAGATVKWTYSSAISNGSSHRNMAAI